MRFLRGDVDLLFACDFLFVGVFTALPFRSGVTEGDFFFFGDGLDGVCDLGGGPSAIPNSSAPFTGVDGFFLLVKYLDFLFEDDCDDCIDDGW